MVMDLHIVTGKGGVGKTRFSVLLSEKMGSCPLSERGNQIVQEATKLGKTSPQVHNITNAELVREFILGVIKVKALASWASKSKVLQNLIRLAPQLDELLLMKDWIRLAQERKIVIDGPSTGNMTAMFDSVRTAQKTFDGGSLRRFADELDRQLMDGSGFHVYIVSLPEISAIEEMEHIHQHLSSLYPKIKLYRVLNRKHDPAPAGVEMPDNLKALAYERPQLEEQRISGIHFDFILKEGATKI